MSNLIYCNLLWLRGKKLLRRIMLRGLKKSDSKKWRIKKGQLLKFKDRESKFSEKCTKLERMSKSRVIREISLKSISTMDLLFTLPSPGMDSLLIKKLISMRFNQKLYHLTKVLKNFPDPYLIKYSTQRFQSISLNLISLKISIDKKQSILITSKRRKTKYSKKLKWLRLLFKTPGKKKPLRKTRKSKVIS